MNRDYTDYQKKIIKRFYDNRDQLDEQRLSELVAELYLAEGKKKAKLWDSVRDLLVRLKVPETRIEHILKSQDASILATVVEDLQNGKIPKS